VGKNGKEGMGLREMEWQMLRNVGNICKEKNRKRGGE
jgi:hypothetical protein